MSSNLDEPSTLEPRAALKSLVDSRRATITLYILITLLYWISLYLYLPTLPTYVESKTENLALVGVVLSMYGLWQALVRLPLGIVADWLGRRKPFVIAGLALAGVGAWIMGSSESAAGLIVGRSVTGLAASAWVPLIVAFSSLFPPHEAVRATAILSAVNSSGRVVATGITGSLNEWGGYSLAFILAAGAAGLAVLLAIPAPERQRPAHRPSVRMTGHLIRRRDVLLPALLAAVNQYTNWAVTFGFNPILARQLGGTGVTQSLLVSMHLGVVIVGNLMATATANRLGPRRLVYLSFGLLAVGIGLAAIAPTLPVLFAAQFCIGLAQGTNYPVLMGMSIQHVDDAERTTAMGLHQAVYAIGMFTGPWLSGMLADGIGIQPMFGVTAVACLLLGLFMTSRLGDPPPDSD